MDGWIAPDEAQVGRKRVDAQKVFSRPEDNVRQDQYEQQNQACSLGARSGALDCR